MNNTNQTGAVKSANTKVKRGRGRPLRYGAFATLKVGEFRLFPKAIRNNVVTSCYLFSKRHGLKFKTSQLEKTVKILRVA